MSIYDRLHQRRQPSSAEPALATAPSPESVPQPLALSLTPTIIQLSGLTLTLPPGKPRALETAIEREGAHANLRIERTPLPITLSLEQARISAQELLKKKHPAFSIVRHSERELGGHLALLLDFTFTQGERIRHGRYVGVLLSSGPDAQEWLEISTRFDPEHPPFADWLIGFDAMLDSLAAVSAPL